MRRNTEALFDEKWLLDVGVLREQYTDLRGGLRFYYPHLSTVAAGGALLGDALDHRRDDPLIRQLQLWQDAAEAFNTRATMAELLLFFLPRTDESMLERLEVHVTIATQTVKRQRTELLELVTALTALKADRQLARSLAQPIAKVREILEERIAADAAAEALIPYLEELVARETAQNDEPSRRTIVAEPDRPE
jgi:hypothetical protein